MKEVRLSAPRERVANISFSICAIVCFGILLYALRKNMGLLIACGLAVLLISALLVYYMISVMKAVCIVDTRNKTVEVKGAAHFTVDVSKAVLLQTFAKKNGQSSLRVLVFSDADEQIVATIPTMFTYKQGALADPMAKEMAESLGIGFKENVPKWEYDKEAFKEHRKQEAAEEKAAAKARREQKAKYRIEKRKKNLK